MKKFATIIGSAALLAASLVPAIAATNDCSNNTTGPFSDNTCTILNNDSITVNNVNDAKIVNNVSTKSNTGDNSASYNTLGGSIFTGDATANVSVANVANINTTEITAAYAGGATNRGGNDTTGPKSNNESYIENNSSVDVYNSNTAEVKNDVDARSNTGRNDANYNTGPAEISTGEAWVGVGVATHVNDNLTEVRGGAGGNGSNFAENSITGPFSDNSVAILNNQSVNVNNVNDMLVKNYVDAKSNTGKNDANKNTLGADIFTGGASTGVGVNTEGNINSTLIALGGFTNNFGENEITGPGGYKEDGGNEVYIANNRSINVDNYNNKCYSHNADDQFGDWEWSWHLKKFVRRGCDVNDIGAFNYVEASNNTGRNDSDKNTGGSEINSGWAEVWQEVLTHMNDSLTEIL